MKLLRFIMKLFATLIGIISVVYIVALYMDFTLRSSISKSNIKSLVNKVDFIEDSQDIFKTEDRIVERTINDIEIGNLTYEDKKEIIYNSKFYNEVKDYFINNIYYFVGYNDSKFSITEKKKEELKELLIEDIKNKDKNATKEELDGVSDALDSAYDGILSIDFESVVDKFPSEYKVVVDHINSTSSIYIEILILIFFLVVNGLLLKDCVSPFKWLSIGLLFSSIISVILFVIASKISLNSIILESLRDTFISTIFYSIIVTVSLCIVSFIIYIVLKLKGKKIEDDMGKTRINIEKINI